MYNKEEFKKFLTDNPIMSEEEAIELLNEIGISNPPQALIDCTRREGERKFCKVASKDLYIWILKSKGYSEKYIDKRVKIFYPSWQF